MTPRIPRSRTARRAAAVTGLTALIATPATLAAGATGPVRIDPAPLTAPLPGSREISDHLRHNGHRIAVHRVERAAERLARARGEHLPRHYRARLADWSVPRLARHERALRRSLRAARRAQAATATTAGAGSAASPALQAIAACESGGDPHAIGGGGAFRGKYQFTYATWAAVGGSGDPAAAPEAEQDRRAAMLYSQAGAGQWPVCGS